MGFDAKMEGYDLVEVDGRICLFSYMRLDPDSVPEGIFCYEVEDSEREDCTFGKIKERVGHRRMGSILCREKLPIGANGEYRPKNPVKMAGEYISLGEFMEIPGEELKQWLGRKQNADSSGCMA